MTLDQQYHQQLPKRLPQSKFYQELSHAIQLVIPLHAKKKKILVIIGIFENLTLESQSFDDFRPYSQSKLELNS